MRETESALLPYCVSAGIAFMPYGPLAFGILGGRYDQSFQLPEGDWRQKLALSAKDLEAIRQALQ